MPSSSPRLRRASSTAGATALAVACLVLGAAPGLGAQAPAAPAAAPASAPIPRAAIDALGDSLAAVLGTGDSARVEAFVAPRLSRTRPADDVARQRRLLARLVREGGPLRAVGGEPTRSGRILELWSDRLGRGVTFAYSVDREDHARFWNLQALRTVDPAAAVRPIRAADGSDTALARAIGDEVRRLGEAGAFSGQVVVARGRQVIWRGAVGSADGAGAPMTMDARLHLASVGKMRTAVAVAQLIEAGRLHWDDSLGAVLPELPWAPGSRGITVRQLLSHRAGFGELWDVPGYERGRDYATNTEVVRLFAATPVRPPAAFSYSNEGFTVLAAIVERLVGRPFAEVVQERINVPAGIATPSVRPDAAMLARRARARPGSPEDPFGTSPRGGAPHDPAWLGGGAGGSYATADDFHRFFVALHEGRLLSPAVRDSLWVRREEVRELSRGYGYGFFVDTVGARRVVGHGGGGPFAGICNELMSDADGGWTVIVLSNVDPPRCAELAWALVRARPPASPSR